MPTIMDGKKVASKIKQEVKQEVKKLKLKPGLAVILLGNNPASQIYVKHKEKACLEVGIKSFCYKLPARTSEKKLLKLIKALNKNKKIHGILVQLPLPKHINEYKIIQAIDPQKDVDGFHPENVGKLTIGNKNFVAATPLGIMELLKFYKIKIKGKHCVVVGRSNIVGKPIALLLLEQHGTVTICHSRSKNLSQITKQADILIAAVGQANLISPKMAKKGVVIIDVAMNRQKNGKLIGDVAFDKVKSKAKVITPVPGGVGPMTIACLMKNCLKAAKNK